MPSLLETKESQSIKLMLIGDSGTGKTGALASLASAGYELFILDFDNGTEILVEVFNKQLKDNVITQDEYNYTLGRIHVESFFDKQKMVGSVFVNVGQPKAFSGALKQLSSWGEFGSVSTWDNTKILVVDSTTMLGESAYKLADFLNPTAKDKRQIYGAAQQNVQKLFEMLYSTDIKCHVIFNTHITYIEVMENVLKGYPTIVGRSLSTKCARYFNVVLGCTVLGSGTGAKRYINTVPLGNVDLKCPILSGLSARLPQATGLAEYFKAKTGKDTA